jgi:TonB-dependent starch-binding outer membrane protein SusC
MKLLYYRKFCRMLILAMMGAGSSVAWAQVIVKGKVSPTEGGALPGVNIIIKGTTSGTTTDADGAFTIEVPSPESVLIFSFIGYETQEVAVGQRTTIVVVLSPDVQTLNEIVVVGYGTAKRGNILGAVSSAKPEDIIQLTPVNAFDAIQGRMSGVNIASNGGPGSGSSIQIRGTSTFNAGTAPLYVVDGQQLENIDNIDPNDIASIEVLKDGASAAIYGSKSANGVIVITTKSGKPGALKFDFNFARAVTFVRSKIPVANTKERLFYEANRAATPLTANLDSLNLLYTNSFDLQDLLFQPGNRTQLNFGVSGGTDKGSFYWNTALMDEGGVVVNSSYQRITTNLKVDGSISKRLKVGTVLNGSYEIQKGLNENEVFQQLVERINYFPVFEPDGSFTPEIAGRQNPLAEATARTQNDRNFRARSFNYIELSLMKQLKLKSTIGVNFQYRKRNDFEPTIVLTPGQKARGQERNDLNYDILQENLLLYNQKFGNHSLDAIAGVSLQKWNTEQTFLRSNSFLFDVVPTLNAIDANGFLQNDTGTFQEKHSLFSYFGEVSYNFKERYLVKATIRRDGSSRFGINERFGVFKSGSIGWRISDENFMSGLSGKISNLLIRASYGENGNERINNYDNQTLYSTGNFYDGINGVAPNSTLGNSKIKWENTISKNLGVDISVFKGKLNTSVDIWNKTTRDLLANIQLPSESGFTSIRSNVGSVENTGIDININGTPLDRGKFSWFSSFNISFLSNKVLELADARGFFDDGMYRIQVGQPIGNFSGFKNNGIFRYNESNAFTDGGLQLTPNFSEQGVFLNYTLNGAPYSGNVNRLKRSGTVLGGGDVHWQDVNGDFDITDADDRQVLGNGLVKYFGGFFNEFTYGDFSLSFLFDYNFGNQIFRNYDQQRNDLNSQNETPSPERIYGAWLKPGDEAEYASLIVARTQNRLTNSQYVSKGDFIKLRNVRFNYDLPKKKLSKMAWSNWINRLSINLTVNNPLTFTNYPGYNPELGNRGNPLQPGLDGLRYPNKTEVIIGLRLQF